jgi:formate hydrogenlyase subunit 3/multisubunit Na+/H+ antiporter MnhD subunit
MCFAARDIKRLVAYSSVSQMGYVLFGLAELTPRGVQGALMHLVNHGIIKALLFMGVGLIMYATGRRQVERISGLLKAMPGVATGMLLGAMGLAGLPPLAIFFDEWLILADGLRTPYPALGYLDFISPLLTAAYALWFTGRLAIGDPPEDMAVRPTPAAMRWPFYVLVVLMFVVGLAPGPLYGWAGQAARLVLGSAP